MIAKTREQVERLRTAGRLMAEVVEEVLALVRPGVSSLELEEAARRATLSRGGRPSFLNYKNKGEKEYPAALCVSINDEIAHSPPRQGKILKAGDIVSIDFGLEFQGAFMDTAYTLAVGEVDEGGRRLIDGTREALDAALAAARALCRTGDIGAAVAAIARKRGLGIVKDLRGHGVGAAVHENPNIPNFGTAGDGEILPEGSVVALEPIFAEGSGAMVTDADGFTYRTRDGSRAAHFEHTVLLAKDGLEILTQIAGK